MVLRNGNWGTAVREAYVRYCWFTVGYSFYIGTASTLYCQNASIITNITINTYDVLFFVPGIRFVLRMQCCVRVSASKFQVLIRRGPRGTTCRWNIHVLAGPARTAPRTKRQPAKLSHAPDGMCGGVGCARRQLRAPRNNSRGVLEHASE